MKYMLLIYADQSKIPTYKPEEQTAAMNQWRKVEQEMKDAGVLLYNDGLAPASSATTVRIRSGKTLIGDGPFAETHEQLGGYMMIDCKDLDEAIGWASKIPGARFGTVEVRPVNIWTMARDERANQA
jgi:hypothetical protein